LAAISGKPLPGEQPATAKRAINATHAMRRYGFMLEYLLKMFL
jgi:hypothetical protein